MDTSFSQTATPSELLVRATRGDLSAQTSLIQIYQKRVAGFVFAMIGQSHSVDDLCQMIFVRTILALPNLRNLESFEPWLWRICHNVCMSHLRKRRLAKLLIPFTLEEHDLPIVTDPATLSEWEWLQHALKRLHAKERELLILLQEDFSYAQMAEITGTSISSVKSRLFRAREQLKAWRENELGK